MAEAPVRATLTRSSATPPLARPLARRVDPPQVRNFRSLQEFLETRYPDLRGEVTGSNYPPPAHGVAAVQVAMAAQWGSLVLAFAGPSVFSTLGMPSPDWYQQLMQNKMTWCVPFCRMGSSPAAGVANPDRTGASPVAPLPPGSWASSLPTLSRRA